MGRASANLDQAPENMASAQVSLDEFWSAADIDYIWPLDPLSPNSPAIPSLGGLLAPTDQYEDSPEAPDNYASSSQGVCVEPTAYGSDPSLTTYQLKPTFMTVDKRFLINHYVTSVVNLFTVTENSKSPWRTLHLPRALQGSGELEATGTTSNARNALLHTILSVSAYNLVNKYRIQGQEASARKWCKKALQMRFRAVNLLKSCLEENLAVASKRTFPGKPKYKELLAAMLSMITIDVVCGDTRTCRIHLKGCESLIRSAKRGWKTKYSSKARALHRTFYYLRVIHASTALVSELATDSKDPSATSGTTGEPHKQQQQQQDKLSSNLKEAESWLGLEQIHSSLDDMSSCEFVYGFPLDLLLLMGRTTELAQQVNLLRRKQWDLLLIPSLAEACDKLEAEVLDWPIDARLASLLRAPVGPETRAIVDHQTRAVHKALIIYFSRHIRLMHRQHLQPYVESVVTHMEAAEEIKDDAGIVAGPMTWPCFIAASEALTEPLQKRFLQWFDKARTYGVEAGSRGREVVVEVWNQRRQGASDVTSDWRRVVEAKTAYLMLT
ncbi:Fungal specific transcription factor domain-containing protein [Cladophialophora immunda]|nr:Fungal specific transcription factor domain-containing protein [Cladophialophora immunda]